MTERSESAAPTRKHSQQQAIAADRNEVLEEHRCGQCGRTLLRRSVVETVYLGRLTRFRGDRAVAVCPTCKSDVPVPLKLSR